MKQSSIDAEPRVLVCLYDFTLWFLQRTNRFPKNWRISLGDRIDDLMINMLLKAHQVRFRKEKLSLLLELSEMLESLRILTRLCAHLGCLADNQQEYVARQIEEIGKQLGGWIKQQTK